MTTLEKAMKAIDATVDFRDGYMTRESAERTVRAVINAIHDDVPKIIQQHKAALYTSEFAEYDFRTVLDFILNEARLERVVEMERDDDRG